MTEQLACRTLPIYILIPVQITPSYGEVHLNTGLKKSNMLKHYFLDGKQIPATSPGDVHLSRIPDDKHGNDAPAHSRISPKSGTGWVVCARGLVPPTPWRNLGRADVPMSMLLRRCITPIVGHLPLNMSSEPARLIAKEQKQNPFSN